MRKPPASRITASSVAGSAARFGQQPQRLGVERPRAAIDDESRRRRRVHRRLAPRGGGREDGRCDDVGAVARPLTTSTSGISGAGLKKCMPTTRPGCFIAAASAVIDSDDVFVARMHSGVTTFSSRAKSSRLAARSSTIASTTSAATQASGSVTTVAMRPTAASASASPSLPFATSFASASAIPFFAASPAPMRVSCSWTRWPASAAICAMPAPIAPAPITATVDPRAAAAAIGAPVQRPGESRRPLGDERGDAFAIVVARPELALQSRSRSSCAASVLPELAWSACLVAREPARRRLRELRGRRVDGGAQAPRRRRTAR